MSLYEPALSGNDWKVVPTLATFLGEVRDCVDDGILDVTNLGTKASPEHLAAAPVSRHNPALAPDGQHYVCAADFGGNPNHFKRLADFWQALYKAHDPRVYGHGFAQWGNGFGLAWYDGGTEWTGKDQGHCHLDVTMKSANLGPDWFLPVLMDTSPWGLRDYLTQHTLRPLGSSATPIGDDLDMDKLIALLSALQQRADTIWSRLEAITPPASQFYFTGSGPSFKFVPRGTPGAKLNKMLMTNDGNTIVSILRQVAGGNAEILAQIDKLGEQITDTEQPAAPTADTAPANV